MGHLEHPAPGGQGALGEPGFFEGVGGANHGFRENRIADQIIVPLLAEDHQVVHIEMEPVPTGEIAQPEGAGAATHGRPLGEFVVQGRHGLVRVAEFLPGHFHPEPLGHPFHDAAGVGPEGGQGQAVEPDKGEIAEKQPRPDAEDHGLADGEAVMGEQIGEHAGFAVGRLAVTERDFHLILVMTRIGRRRPFEPRYGDFEEIGVPLEQVRRQFAKGSGLQMAFDPPTGQVHVAGQQSDGHQVFLHMVGQGAPPAGPDEPELFVEFPLDDLPCLFVGDVLRRPSDALNLDIPPGFVEGIGDLFHVFGADILGNVRFSHGARLAECNYRLR